MDSLPITNEMQLGSVTIHDHKEADIDYLLNAVHQLKQVLRAHNNWHLSQGETTVGGITWNLAEAYSDSKLYEDTEAALNL